MLVYAHRPESERHSQARKWLDEALNSSVPFALNEMILASVYRVVTNKRAYAPPTMPVDALTFISDLRSSRNAVPISAGARHWDLLERLLLSTGTIGPDTSDAVLAALALEHDCTFYSFDKDFARFPGLKWRVPE